MVLEAAKDWLRFGFRAYSGFPDYPWINSSYDDVVWLWKKLTSEVGRTALPA